MQPLLSVDLCVSYAGKANVLRNLRFTMNSGEILGFAGQSGCGKSTLAFALMRLLSTRTASIQGCVEFRGQDLLRLSERQMRGIRGREIGMALQAAASALNPYLRIETQLKEAWRAHEKSPWSAGRLRAVETLAAMGLVCDSAFLRRYPGQISIGQAQRIVLAMAMMHRPSLLIADEPTSALDLISQVELLKLLKRINRDFGTAILYISHDLPTVASICDRVCILHNGAIAETGTPAELFRKPADGFTQSLINAYQALHTGTGMHTSVLP